MLASLWIDQAPTCKTLQQMVWEKQKHDGRVRAAMKTGKRLPVPFVPPPVAPPFYASPKFDGVRCVALLLIPCSTKGPQEALTRRNIALYSRNGNRFRGITVIEDALLKHCWQWHRRLVARGAPRSGHVVLVLDGELCVPPGTQSSSATGNSSATDFEAVLSCLRTVSSGKKRNNDTPLLQRTLRALRLMVFDLPVLQPKANAKCDERKILRPRWAPVIPRETPFFARLHALRRLLRPSKHSVVQPVQHTAAMSLQRIRDSILPQYLRNHQEGVVVRTACNLLVPGQRSQSMFKLVPWRDSEFQVLRIIPMATKSNQNIISALECVTPTGKVFRVPAAVSPDIQKKWWVQRHNTVGMFATIRYASTTGHGVPRFGRIKGLRGSAGQLL